VRPVPRARAVPVLTEPALFPTSQLLAGQDDDDSDRDQDGGNREGRRRHIFWMQ